MKGVRNSHSIERTAIENFFEEHKLMEEHAIRESACANGAQRSECRRLAETLRSVAEQNFRVSRIALKS